MIPLSDDRLSPDILQAKRELQSFDRSYQELRAHWEKIRDCFGACFDDRVLEGPPGKCNKVEGGDELHIEIFGARAYIRFSHDLEKGYLEYGAFEQSDEGLPNTSRHAPIRTTEFDREGKIEGRYVECKIVGDSYIAIHLRTLADIVPALVRAYYGISPSGAERVVLAE